MKSLIEDIKNQQYKKVYLLYGPEAYLKSQYKQKLLEALVPEEDTMNLPGLRARVRMKGKLWIWPRRCLFLPTGA